MGARRRPVPAGPEPGGAAVLDLPDRLVRPAVEAAVAVARLGAEADPPVAAPRGLRPFLDFTRLPDRAVGAAWRVLDDHPEFRHLVRDSTSEDLIGRASWLFLDRPEGWRDELGGLAAEARAELGEASRRQAESSASKRLTAAEDARRRADDVAARAQAEVAELKDQLAAERRSRHLAETEAGRLRRRASEAEAEVESLRSSVARLEAAPEARAPERRPAEPPGTSSPEPPAPPAPVAEEMAARDHLAADRRGLASAHAAAVDAAEALSAALADIARRLEPSSPTAPVSGVAPPPPRLPPAERAVLRRRRPLPLPPALLDDSVEAAEHLLRIGSVLVLVDGYNLTLLARPELALSEQRQWLVDAAIESATRTGARFEIVFDGADDRGSAPAHLGRRIGVQVRFSPTGVQADDVLLERVGALEAWPVVVASDDRRVRDGARELGANVVGARQLLAALKRPVGP